MRANRTPCRIAALLAIATVLYSGCGLSFVTKLEAPAMITATTDQVEQITLTWSEVDNANNYFVYRSTVPTGPFGPYEATPYRTLEGNSFIDTDVADGDYYYKVSAGDGFDRLESPLSDLVQGTAVAAPLQWRLPVLVGIGAGLVDVAVDTLVAGEPKYVLTAPAEFGAELSVYRIVNDTVLERVGVPFGAIDGTVRGSAALAVAGGSLYVASTDDTGLLDTNAEVILWHFDAGTGTWVAEPASASLSEAEPSAPWIDLEARSANDLFLAYRARGSVLNGPIAAYRYNGTSATDLATILVSGGTDDVTSVRLAVTATDEALIYKDVSGLGEIVVASLVAGVWDNPAVISDADDVIPDGYVDASIDPNTGDLYVAYYDDTDSELRIKKNDAATWLSPDPGAADPGTTSVAVSARNGEVMAFFADQSGGGVIRHFTGTAWETISPEPLTLGGALASLVMRSTTSGLIIGYIEATLGTVRLYR